MCVGDGAEVAGEAVHWLYHWLQRWGLSLGEQGETGRQDPNVKSCATEITQVLLCTARGLPFEREASPASTGLRVARPPWARPGFLAAAPVRKHNVSA